AVTVRTFARPAATNSRAVVRPERIRGLCARANPEKLMTSLADCAPAEANTEDERRGPSPWVAALLTMLTPGLGHIYIGQARRGITLFILVMIADTLLMFAMMGVLARFWMFAVSLGLLLGLWIYIMVDAVHRAQRMRDYPHHGYHRWTTYTGAF